MEICINMRSIVIVITEASYHFTIRHYNIMQSRWSSYIKSQTNELHQG